MPLASTHCSTCIHDYRDNHECVCHTTFPMLGGPPIPWMLAETIYLAVFLPLYGARRSLTDLAKNGGFSWSEIADMTRQYSAKFDVAPQWERYAL